MLGNYKGASCFLWGEWLSEHQVFI